MKNENATPVIVFDLNETLLDITTLEPLFDRIFDNPAVLRLWFAELVLYSQTVTLAGIYLPFGALAAATLSMTAANKGLIATDDDIADLNRLIGNMPVYSDVVPALSRLRDAGFRLTTLTNSSSGSSPTPLEKAGISDFFQRNFSVDTVRKFKPAPETYQLVAREMGVKNGDLCLVACHLWDIIGAQTAGCVGAFVKRPHNNLLFAEGVMVPDLIADDLGDLTTLIINEYS